MLPSPKIIFIIVMINIGMFTLSYGLHEFFGGSEFVETNIDDALVIPTFPDISFDSIGAATAGIWDVIMFLADSFSLFMSVFSFDIVGLPTMIRFVLITPLAIMNLYLGFAIVLRIAEVVGGWIPFTG